MTSTTYWIARLCTCNLIKEDGPDVLSHLGCAIPGMQSTAWPTHSAVPPQRMARDFWKDSSWICIVVVYVCSNVVLCFSCLFFCFFNHEGSTGKFIHLSQEESLKAYRNLSRSTHYNKYHCDMFSRVTISTDAGSSSGFRKRVLVGCRRITSSFSKTKSFSTSCERFPLTSGLMDGFLINLWHSWNKLKFNYLTNVVQYYSILTQRS